MRSIALIHFLVASATALADTTNFDDAKNRSAPKRLGRHTNGERDGEVDRRKG